MNFGSTNEAVIIVDEESSTGADKILGKWLTSSSKQDIPAGDKHYFKCPCCDYHVDCLDRFWRHLQLKHKIGPYRYLCYMCARRFSHPKHLTVHLKSHCFSAPCKCHICGQNFKSEQILVKHLQGHYKSDRGLLECRICGAFVAHNILKQHSQKHANLCKTYGSNRSENVGKINLQPEQCSINTVPLRRTGTQQDLSATLGHFGTNNESCETEELSSCSSSAAIFSFDVESSMNDIFQADRTPVTNYGAHISNNDHSQYEQLSENFLQSDVSEQEFQLKLSDCIVVRNTYGEWLEWVLTTEFP